MREMRNAYKILVEKREGKRPRGRFRHRWEDNIRTHLREIMWKDEGWVHLGHFPWGKAAGA
jgi:hypothetical protein